jgi:hypothetical protein
MATRPRYVTLGREAKARLLASRARRNPSSWVAPVVGAVVAAAAGGGLYWYLTTKSSSPGSSGCVTGRCDSSCPCPVGQNCVDGVCVQSSSSSSACTGYCSCADGDSCDDDCGACGFGEWACNKGICYQPFPYFVTSDLLSVQVPTYGYRSDYCCEYAVTAVTHMCGFCALNCGASTLTSGAATFTIKTMDQFSHPAAGVAVYASAAPNSVGKGLLSVSPTSATTNADGQATFTITVAGPPPPYNDSSQYPSCAGTYCVPFVGICYCSGGTGYTNTLLNGGGTSVGQINWGVTGRASLSGVTLVSALVYGSCKYLGYNIDEGGCNCL